MNFKNEEYLLLLQDEVKLTLYIFCSMSKISSTVAEYGFFISKKAFFFLKMKHKTYKVLIVSYLSIKHLLKINNQVDEIHCVLSNSVLYCRVQVRDQSSEK